MKIDDDINELVKKLLAMAQQVEENLIECSRFYKGEIIDCIIDDDKIDNMEREIERNCLDIMIKERPFAKDMREISGILTLVSDVERLGDHAEDIYTLGKKISKISSCGSKSIYNMLDKALKMVHDAIISFINKDENLANSVINRDDEIDGLYESEINALIEDDTSRTISSNLAILNALVVKYIERIADHAVNIAEWVIFLIRGYYKDAQIF